MKNFAQAILQFTRYPLEPNVALQINKSFQFQPNTSDDNIRPVFSEALAGYRAFYQATDMDERWFSNYE